MTIRILHVAKWNTSCQLYGYPMEKQILVCVVGDHSGGGVDVTTAGYVGDVFVGLVPGRYDHKA